MKTVPASKSKRKPRRKRTAGIKSNVNVKTPAKMREAFPASLIKAFVAISSDRWESDELYKKYRKEAAKYVGKEKIEDPIESGRLVVNLARATMYFVEKNPTETYGQPKKKAAEPTRD